MSSKICKNGSNCKSNRELNQSFDANCCNMGVPNWLFEIGAVMAIASMFLSSWRWLAFGLCYVLFRALNSEVGRRCLKTLPRDAKGIALLIKVQLKLRRELRRNRPLHEHFLTTVNKFAEKECVIEVETGRSLNFRQFNEHSNKYANFFKDKNYVKGDVVAIYLENGIEFFASWFGISKLGVISAWINSNLKLESLAHSINVSHCKAVITSQALLPKLRDSIGLLDKKIDIYVVDGDNSRNGEYHLLSKSLKNVSEPPRIEELTFQDVLCYIYTSGTTGNPKAAIIRHYRYYYISVASRLAFGVKDTDRLYITLPMYHSSGGILGISHVLTNGSTAVIRTKFSARNFWSDCIKFDCTVSQYIGEICRYLLAQAPSEDEKRHNVRVMFGNGLRPEIWAEFVKRFRLRRIGELYGSTEGNSNILNLNNHQGSCGFMPIYPLLHRLNVYPIRLAKINEDTGELIRDPKTGLCVMCEPGDTGEMIGTIRTNDPMLRFEGYVNGSDTQKKIIRDVLKKGDCAFSSGDILYWDELGYLYFKDRCGDTFRWKGENCATTEIEGVVQPIMSISDVTVYGVEVPNCEGRAGMIAISLVNGAEVEAVLSEVAERLCKNLASYSIPIFLRICKVVDRTGTFKMKKNELRDQGYNFSMCGRDPLYYWSNAEKQYKPLDAGIQNQIDCGAIRL